MARLARGDLFDPAEVSAFHCMSRCVRRSFLCGDDPYNGRNYDHRKLWIEQRIQFLAGLFGIDVLYLTSVQRRIESLDFAQDSAARPDAWLTPIELNEATTAPGPQPSVSANVSPKRASDKGCLSISLPDYLELVDWTGRQIVAGKSNMPDHLPPILQRLGMEATNWVPLIRNFGRLFHRVAGAPRTLDRHARWRRFRPGRAELLGTG